MLLVQLARLGPQSLRAKLARRHQQMALPVNEAHADYNAKYVALNQLIDEVINVKSIRDDWKEVLHLAASIRTGTVSASVMLKKLAG